MIKIGITGTQVGMNELQRKELSKVLKYSYQVGSEFHHGDCVGVDVEAASIAFHLGYRIVCHPPENPRKRGNYGGEKIMPEKDYLVRNRNIVDAIDNLIVVPQGMVEERRSGTWFTYRYAKKQRKNLIVIWPKFREQGLK